MRVEAAWWIALALLATACFDAHQELRVDAGARDAGFSEGDAGALDAGASPDELLVQDTLGWRVRFACFDDVCIAPGEQVPPDFPVRCPEGMRPHVALDGGGRLAALWATCGENGGWYGWSELARPVVCGDDRACERLPHFEGTPRCLDGLCQVPEAPLQHNDVMALCLARVPRPWEVSPESFGYSLELLRARELADASCAGGECRIPEECRW